MFVLSPPHLYLEQQGVKALVRHAKSQQQMATPTAAQAAHSDVQDTLDDCDVNSGMTRSQLSSAAAADCW